MSTSQGNFVLLAVVVMAGAAGAAPPPVDLPQLLQHEPLNAPNWAKWSDRLHDWSGEHYAAAAPAFEKAFDFLRAATTGPDGKRRGMPKTLEKDAVAWMVLAGAYLNDPQPAQGPVPTARAAAEAARQSIRRDGSLARAHFWLSLAMQREQLTPLERGGPTRPDRGKLREALKPLQEARALDPRVAWMPVADMARLAVAAEAWTDAESFLRFALNDSPNDVELARLLARAVNEQPSGIRQGMAYRADIEPLVQAFPNDGVLVSHYARALMQDGKRDEAAAQIARARQLGIDPSKVLDSRRVKELDDEQSRKRSEAEHKKADDNRRAEEEQRKRTEENRRRAEDEHRRAQEVRRRAEANAPGLFSKLGWWAMGFCVFYGTVMGLMCLTGWLLARRTHGKYTAQLREERPRSMTTSGKVARTVHELRLGRFYLVALLTALVLFYLSLPFVFFGLLLVLALTLGLSFVIARDSRAADVHAALLQASSGGIGAVFKAMFARTSGGGFGKEKDKEDCPQLFAAIEEVALRVETDPPDEVYLSPGNDFWVRQQGRGPFGVFGSRKRVLSIGLCVMDCLTVEELKSILAHEFAHFSHADTYWNRFVFQVTLSLRTAMTEMARAGGFVTSCNPFYWFFWLYSKSYSLLAAGFSRSREYLADRMACTLYGSDIFSNALRKVCTEGSYFETTIYKDIARLLKQKKAYVNMYIAFRKRRDEDLTDSERRKLHKKLLSSEPSMFGSHPTFQERMEAARWLPTAVKTEGTPALQLLDKPEEVEKEMTDFLTKVVAEYMQI
jgi:Zn-dependent protease with chaperone function